MESMDDYKEELEASLKKIRVGDVVTGTVIDVTDDAVIVDLKAYADGVIRKDDLSEDPDFNMAEMIHPGDEITATVMATNDGEGNMVLSKKEANQVLAWDKLKNMMEERTVVPVKIAEIVNAGAVAYLEGIRGFIPASRLRRVCGRLKGIRRKDHRGNRYHRRRGDTPPRIIRPRGSEREETGRDKQKNSKMRSRRCHEGYCRDLKGLRRICRA